MLSCSCSDWDGDGWWYYPPNDFTKFKAKRRKRCCSCKELIDIGADCLEFCRTRGDEIGMAPLHMCEKCGEIYFNLESAGYCLDIIENMNDYLKEYHELTGFKPAELAAGRGGDMEIICGFIWILGWWITDGITKKDDGSLLKYFAFFVIWPIQLGRFIRRVIDQRS